MQINPVAIHSIDFVLTHASSQASILWQAGRSESSFTGVADPGGLLRGGPECFYSHR